ncbi:MAG: hypothetical protein AAB403_19390 [Planctomycetota bacterium]
MRDVCVVLAVVLNLIFTVRYCRRIFTSAESPTISTWIVFLVGVVISFVSYVMTENHDLRSGILNTLDLAVVSAILIAVFVDGRWRASFDWFQKGFLWVAAALIAYGFISGDAWRSNLLAQILIGTGFIPLYRRLIVTKRNTEPFEPWLLSLASALVSIYPAMTGGNSLALIYTLRAATGLIILLLLMLYYEHRSRLAHQSS